MIKLDKVTFKALRKMNLRDRIAAIQDPQYGNVLMSALTPTDLTALFPREYLRGSPDISGFLKAIPSGVTAERQRQRDQEIAGAARPEILPTTPGSGFDKVKQRIRESQTAGRNMPPDYQFTPEEASAWQKIQKEPISIDSEEGKTFSKLTDEARAKIHVVKETDPETKKEIFKYKPPEVTKEQIEAALSRPASVYNDISGKSITGYGGITDEQIRAILRKEATARGINPDLAVRVFGHEGLGNYSSLADGSRWNKKYEPSYGPLQLQTASGMGRDFINATGIDPSTDRSPKSVVKQIQYGLNRVVTDGWGAWEGAKAEKIYGKMGVGQDARTLPLSDENFVPAGKPEPDYTSNRGGIPESMVNYGADQTKGVEPKGPNNTYTAEQMDYGDRLVREAQTATEKQNAKEVFSKMREANRLVDVRHGEFPEWVTDRSKRELSALNSAFVVDLLEASKRTGIKFNVTQGMRTSEEAAQNAASGRGVRNSQHLYGAAADIKLLDENGRPIGHERRDLYEKFAAAYEASSREKGGSGRWLGNSKNWSHDIWHFDQGLSYGQSHKRDPYGSLRPTVEDVTQTYKETSPERHPFGAMAISEKERELKTPTDAALAAPVTAVTEGTMAPPAPTAQELTQPQAPSPAPTTPKAPTATTPKGPAAPPTPKGPEAPTTPKRESKEDKQTQTPTSATPVSTTPTSATATTPSQKLEASVTTTPQVPAKAEGGKVDVKTQEQLVAKPIGGLRGDNTLVVDQESNPVFTMNTNKEAAVYNPVQQKVDIIPTQKNDGNFLDTMSSQMQQAGNVDIKAELNNLADTLRQEFQGLTSDQNKQAPNKVPMTISDRDPEMINQLTNVTSSPYRTPSSQRAFYRARFGETGEPVNDFHHQIGSSAVT